MSPVAKHKPNKQLISTPPHCSSPMLPLSFCLEIEHPEVAQAATCTSASRTAWGFGKLHIAAGEVSLLLHGAAPGRGPGRPPKTSSCPAAQAEVWRYRAGGPSAAWISSQRFAFGARKRGLCDTVGKRPCWHGFGRLQVQGPEVAEEVVAILGSSTAPFHSARDLRGNPGAHTLNSEPEILSLLLFPPSPRKKKH